MGRFPAATWWSPRRRQRSWWRRVGPMSGRGPAWHNRRPPPNPPNRYQGTGRRSGYPRRGKTANTADVSPALSPNPPRGDQQDDQPCTSAQTPASARHPPRPAMSARAGRGWPGLGPRASSPYLVNRRLGARDLLPRSRQNPGNQKERLRDRQRRSPAPLVRRGHPNPQLDGRSSRGVAPPSWQSG